jgi:hypothetical protein
MTTEQSSGEPRRLGQLAGLIRESEGWWGPDPEIEALFYGDATALGTATRFRGNATEPRLVADAREDEGNG